MPSAKRPRFRAPELRRDQVLDAAERVLVAKGLDTATVADVAAAAGIAKGTVYLYFESKSVLLAALRQRYIERFAAALSEQSSRAGVRSRIDRLVDGLFSFSIAQAALHRVLFVEAGYSEEDAFAGARPLVTQLALDAGVRPAQLDATVTFAMHGLHGLLIASLHDPAAHTAAAAAAKQILARTFGV